MPEWTAILISPDDDFDGAPLLRREFVLEDGHGPVRRATLHATAHGVFEAYVNGQPVSDDVLSPGWSSYEWRLRYRSYDVTALVHRTHRARIALGNGWYRGRLGWQRRPRLLRRRAGRASRSWRSTSPTATCRRSSPTSPGLPARRPSSPTTSTTARRSTPAPIGRLAAARLRRPRLDGRASGELDPATLTPYIGPPVRRQEELRAGPDLDLAVGQDARRLRSEPGRLGAVRVRGEAGPTVTLRHAEVLEHDELGVRPLRTAKATDRFVLSGGEDVFEPTFTFHGFRYVEVDGWPGRAHCGRADRRGRPLRARADRHLRVLRRAAQPAAPQRRVGHPRELPRRADRLSAARRAARVDR